MGSDIKELVQQNSKLSFDEIPSKEVLPEGNYFNITQPQALYLLKDIRGDIFVGSSNISRSALTSGIEWNYRLIILNQFHLQK